MSKKSLSKKVEDLNLDVNIEDLESSVKALGDTCILFIKNILRKNMKKAYSLLLFKKEMYSCGNGDYLTMPELHILDKKNKSAIYGLDLGYYHWANLNKDYKGKIREKGYINSINRLLESLGYKISEESFSKKYKGGAGGGSGG